MTKVAIVGAGEIGGSTAHALAGIDRIGRLLLVDAVGPAAAGKALDLRQAGAIGGTHAQLEGTDDPTRVAGCDVCVVADRFERAERAQEGATEALAGSVGEWHGEEGLALLRQLMPYVGRAPIVFAGALQSDLLSAAAVELSVDRRRLLGSAPEAFASAATAIVAMEANCSPREVRLTVLGTPPSRLVIPWSEASIGGYGLQQVLTPVHLRRVEARAAVLWPPGPYALGAAAARVVTAILSSSRQSFCVLTQLLGEFGVRNRTGCLPVRLGPHGIVEIRVPELTTRERVQVQTALGA
jgi:malate dehydrogenase